MVEYSDISTAMDEMYTFWFVSKDTCHERSEPKLKPNKQQSYERGHSQSKNLMTEEEAKALVKQKDRLSETEKICILHHDPNDYKL